MRHHLKCPPGPRGCLTKDEAVVGVVEVVGEEEEEEEEEGEEVVSKETSRKNTAPRVEWEAIKSMGYMWGTREKAVTKEVVDREGEVAGTKEEEEGFKALAGLVEGIMEIAVEGDTEVVVQEVTVEVPMVNKGMEEEAMVDKDIEEAMVDKDMEEGAMMDKDMEEEAMEVEEEVTAEGGDEGVIESPGWQHLCDFAFYSNIVVCGAVHSF